MPEAREAKHIKEIVIISGKGGAGKTSVAAALAHIAQEAHPGETVLCDLDVDAPDLHILLHPAPRFSDEFYSGNEASIVQDDCTGCGTCMAMCRYSAVARTGETYAIDPLRCEGCKVCVASCPENAIAFPQRHCGSWSVSDTRFGTMVHAQLFPGQENSGRLVTLLKQQSRLKAQTEGASRILCDGAPGIGCPVISSLSGAALALIVTEPTPSGRHDLERVAELCDHFRIPVAVCINKYDLNRDEERAIERFCEERHYEIIGRLPHDPRVTETMVRRLAVTESLHTPTVTALRSIWERVAALTSTNQKQGATS